MTKSMTGFGKAIAEFKNKTICIEIRSLNSKQLDLNVRMPHLYKEKELEVRNIVGKALERGKIDLNIHIESSVEKKEIGLNKKLATQYYQQLKEFSLSVNEPSTPLIPIITKISDVWQSEKEELQEDEWTCLLKTLETAIDKINTFRKDEGTVLSDEISHRVFTIKNLLTSIEELDPLRIKNTKEKIKNSLHEVIDQMAIDQNRFEQELIYYIEKIDITEEKVRLKTHCNYFITTLKEDSAGRKLGFITQEIGREINTIGSKANDASIQHKVVLMKDELEKIKEQLLNIL